MMRLTYRLSKFLLAITFPFLVACSGETSSSSHLQNSSSGVNKDVLELTVYKTKNCGCCNDWIAHLNESGIKTKAVDVSFDKINIIKAEHKVKPRQRSCHTAVSEEGFVFEGHVPAKFIKQFLAEKHQPQVIGLTVPEMPIGTPGMEVGDTFHQYDIEEITTSLNHQVYKSISRYEEQF